MRLRSHEGSMRSLQKRRFSSVEQRNSVRRGDSSCRIEHLRSPHAQRQRQRAQRRRPSEESDG